VWDHRLQRFFAAASPSSAAASSKKPGLKHLLLSWPQSFRGQLEDASSVSLPGPVFSLHPIFSSAPAADTPPQAVADHSSADDPTPAEPQPQEAEAAEQQADNSSQVPVTEQAWVREWVEGASRAAQAAPEPAHAPDEEVSTSGRGQSAAEGSTAGRGPPGVFVVHTNGTVGLDTLYTRWVRFSFTVIQ
jgi:hypothetical protein